MTTVRPIGGYFELERTKKNNPFPQQGGYLVNSGRHALELILCSIGKIDCLWIPYFTCEVVLQPLQRLGIEHKLYSIDETLRIDEMPEMGRNDYLLYTNYFGIMDDYCTELADMLGEKLIIDNAQALMAKRLEGVKTFYSPRKYVGIPDGGIAFTDSTFDYDSLDWDVSYNRCSHLLKRVDLGSAEGYANFRQNSAQITVSPLLKMSKLTKYMLESIDYEGVALQRNLNFAYLHSQLGDYNLFEIPKADSFACPMVYPLLVDDSDLKKYLINNKVFVATYWPNVLEWTKVGTVEYNLTSKLLAIPVDQRYGREDMDRIICLIKTYLNK